MQGVTQSQESGLGERIQQRLTVGEMSARRGMTYADLSGQITERKLLGAVFTKAAFRGIE